MTYLECEIPEKVGYLVPIGDIHLGDKSCSDHSLAKLKGYIEWVRTTPGARVFLMGDIFNVATRSSVTSPFEAKDMDEFGFATELFEPIKAQICGAISGNHEFRLEDIANFDLTYRLCATLGIPFAHISCLLNVKVAERPEDQDGRFREQYQIYLHHTTGGGGTTGGKVNRVEKLMDIFEGCDAYVGGHNHGMFTAMRRRFYPNVRTKTIEERRIALIGIGGYLEWSGSYSERKMLPPAKIGGVRIRLDGESHDIHVSE